MFLILQQHTIKEKRMKTGIKNLLLFTLLIVNQLIILPITEAKNSISSPVSASQGVPAAQGGKTRILDLDGLMKLEISNSHAYARVLSYDPVGANIIHFIIVSEGADIKLTKYKPPYNTEYWQKTEYTTAPYNNIYFESGALWPSVSYASDFDSREKAGLALGGSIKAMNGNEYSFYTATEDKAITSKYNNVATSMYGVRVFTVAADVAAKIGGPKPQTIKRGTIIQEYTLPPGAGSLPVSYISNPNISLLPKDGWHQVFYDYVNNVVGIEINNQGNAEMREGNKFYVENKGNNQVTLKTENGKYLGIDGVSAKGKAAQALNNPYLWNITFENNAGFFGNNRYSLRPSENTTLLLSTSGIVKEGTPLLLTAHVGTDAPSNAEFTFFPTDKPKTEKVKSETQKQDAQKPVNNKIKEGGVFYIKSSKNPNFVIDVSEASRQDGAKLLIYKSNKADNQKFKITKIAENQYTIRSVHADKWIKSSGTKGAVLIQSNSVTNKNQTTFTISEQADGTYRIMDSRGFYFGISAGKIENGTNIILWTKASDASQTFILEKVK